LIVLPRLLPALNLQLRTNRGAAEPVGVSIMNIP
jgi:hypothetical protein